MRLETIMLHVRGPGPQLVHGRFAGSLKIQNQRTPCSFCTSLHHSLSYHLPPSQSEIQTSSITVSDTDFLHHSLSYQLPPSQSEIQTFLVTISHPDFLHHSLGHRLPPPQSQIQTSSVTVFHTNFLHRSRHRHSTSYNPPPLFSIQELSRSSDESSPPTSCLSEAISTSTRRIMRHYWPLR